MGSRQVFGAMLCLNAVRYAASKLRERAHRGRDCNA